MIRLTHTLSVCDSDGGEPTDDPPEFESVEIDFEECVAKVPEFDVNSIQFTPGFVKKKYAFEIKEIPRGESDWVELTYPFSGEFNAFYRCPLTSTI